MDSYESSTPLLDDSRQGRRKTDHVNVAIISTAFFVVFMAYNTLQNYVTTLLPGNLGNESLGILYASCCCSVFSATTIVRKMGEKWTMVLGAACYVIYMLSLIKVIPALVYAASVIIGFGAAILWVALGSFLLKCASEDEKGKVSGFFWTVFQLSNVVGNLASFFVLRNTSGSTLLFIGFAGVSGLGTLSLMLLRKLPVDSNDNDDDDDDDVPTPCEEAATVFKHLLEPEMLGLAYMFLFTGLELAFWTGEFPQLLSDSDSIGLVLTFAGIGECLGGFSLGRISDTVGRSSTIVFATVVYGTGLTLSCFLQKAPDSFDPNWEHAPWIAYCAAFCFGLGDSGLNTQCYALVGDLCNNDSGLVASFTVLQLYQNLGSAAGFYYALILPMHGKDGTFGQVWVQTFLIAVGVPLFIYIDKRYTQKESENINVEVNV